MCLVFSGRALAIKPVDIQADPKQGWGGKVGFSLNGKSGNSNEDNYDSSLTIRNRKRDGVWLVLGSKSYGKTNDIRDEDEGLLHLRRIQRNLLAENLDLEGFAQTEYDEFKDLEDRKLAGGGIRWRAALNETSIGDITNFLGLGLFYEVENTKSGLGDDEGTRINFYDKLIWDFIFNEFKMKFYSTIYIQPKAKNFNDTRATISPGFEIPIFQRLFLNIELEWEHDSKPPPNVKQTDFEYNIKFNYSFD